MIQRVTPARCIIRPRPLSHPARTGPRYEIQDINLIHNTPSTTWLVRTGKKMLLPSQRGKLRTTPSYRKWNVCISVSAVLNTYIRSKKGRRPTRTAKKKTTSPYTATWDLHTQPCEWVWPVLHAPISFCGGWLAKRKWNRLLDARSLLLFSAIHKTNNSIEFWPWLVSGQIKSRSVDY